MFCFITVKIISMVLQIFMNTNLTIKPINDVVNAYIKSKRTDTHTQTRTHIHTVTHTDADMYVYMQRSCEHIVDGH